MEEISIGIAGRRAWVGLLGLIGTALVGLSAAGPASAAKGDPEPRIIGGSETTIAQWPWQVALTDRGQAICGGSLLTPTIVVTAAHCVYDFDANRFPASLPGYAAITGRTRLSSNEGQVSAIQQLHAPRNASGQPLYNPNSSAWDAVLLELASPSSSEPIKIAGADEGALWTAGRAAYVTGWGSTNPRGGGYPDALRVAEVPMVSDAACRSSWGNGFVASVMVCAGDGSAPQRDTCDGDSGGPLVVPTAAGEYRLVGDTSYGAQICGSGGVYGRLAGDQMRNSIRSMALSISGVDVVGSGATPPGGPAPTPTPTPPTPDPPAPGSLTLEAAESVALRFSKRSCRLDRDCRRYFAACTARGAGFNCKAYNFDKFRGRRYTYTRKLRITERGDGSIKLAKRGRWKLKRGWR